MNRFDEFATKWDTQPMRVQTALAIADNISSHINDLDDVNVLDFGCGTGLLAFGVCENLGSRYSSLVGMDSSNEMLKVFVDKATTIGYKNFSAKFCDANSEYTIDGKYNLIISSMTMHHIKDYKAFIKKCADALVDGGYLAIGDLALEDGTFHTDNTGVEHFGFALDDIRDVFAQYLELVSLDIVETMKKDDKEYHIFTAIGKKIANR